MPPRLLREADFAASIGVCLQQAWAPILEQLFSISLAAAASDVASRRRGAANRWCLKLHQSLWEKVDCASKKIKFPTEKCSKTALMLVFRPSRRWFSVGFQYFSKGTGEFSKLPLINRIQGSKQLQHRQRPGGAKILYFQLGSLYESPHTPD